MLAAYALSQTSLGPFDVETVFDTECLPEHSTYNFSTTVFKIHIINILSLCMRSCFIVKNSTLGNENRMLLRKTCV